jgi:hypothetical protein
MGPSIERTCPERKFGRRVYALGVHRVLQESGAESERQSVQIPPQISQSAGRLAATVLARERTLPVAAAFRGVLPDDGLARGRTFACSGVADWSIAFALASEAVGRGSWVAAIDVPALGAEAVAELGVTLDRLVRIDARSTASWAEVVAAAIDGFDLVVASVPAGSASVVRRIQTRVKARGSVLVLVGESAAADVQLHTARPVWERAAGGDGHLRARRVRLEVAGRRMPQPRRVDLLLPGPAGGVEAVAPAVAASAEAPMELLRSVG